MKLVEKALDVPKTEHYAILVYKQHSVYHEGDERSRTNPGHGYPAYTEVFTKAEHYVTQNYSIWETEVRRLAGKKEQFVAFKVNQLAEIKTTVSIEVKLLITWINFHNVPALGMSYEFF
jgi:hypothetical protein